MRARARGLFGDARSRRWDAAVGVGVRPFSVSQVDSEKKNHKERVFCLFFCQECRFDTSEKRQRGILTDFVWGK